MDCSRTVRPASSFEPAGWGGAGPEAGYGTSRWSGPIEERLGRRIVESGIQDRATASTSTTSSPSSASLGEPTPNATVGAQTVGDYATYLPMAGYQRPDCGSEGRAALDGGLAGAPILAGRAALRWRVGIQPGGHRAPCITQAPVRHLKLVRAELWPLGRAGCQRGRVEALPVRRASRQADAVAKRGSG